MELKRALVLGSKRPIAVRVTGTVLAVELPFVILATIAFTRLLGLATAGQVVAAGLVAASLFAVKLLLWIPLVARILRPAERAVAAGKEASLELLEQGGTAVHRAMVSGPITAALAWGVIYFGAASIMHIALPSGLPFAWRSLLVVVMYSTAVILAVLPVACGIFAWRLAPVSAALSLAARAARVRTPDPRPEPVRRALSLRARLVLFAMCLTLAPTLWLMSLGYGLELARQEPTSMFLQTSALFGVIALLWAVVATAVLASAIGGPVAGISKVVAKIAAAGGIVPDRAPVYRQDEVGRLAEDVNQMADQLAYVEGTKRQFIAVAAHELRTPLAVLKGYAQLLHEDRRGRVAPATAIAGIERGTDRIDHLVGYLLELVQLQLAEVALRTRRFDLAELVRDIAAHESTASARQIRVTAADGCVVSADPTRITRVLGALLSNATKYSPPTAPIEIQVEKAAHDATVRVVDRGIGIPAPQQHRIFEPFYRAHADSPFDVGGLGIGLYTAREVVRQHGGDMGFSSAEGKGSTFWFRLPLAPGEGSDGG